MGLLDALYRALLSRGQTSATTLAHYARNRGLAMTGAGLLVPRHGVVVEIAPPEITARVAAPTGASRPPADDDVNALWKEVRTASPSVVLTSDGTTVRMRTDAPISSEWLLDAMIEVVARMARDGMMPPC